VERLQWWKIRRRRQGTSIYRRHRQNVSSEDKRGFEASQNPYGLVNTNVRFAPKSGHWNSVAQCPLCATADIDWLLNHLARFGKQCWRYRQPEGLGGLEIDHEIELARLQYR
jgi:hypothetical protein